MGKTVYFMLSNVAQGSGQFSNANDYGSIEMENESELGQFLPIIKLIKRKEKFPLKNILSLINIKCNYS